MAGAGSNMLRVHAYVKLLAVTTWIITIWPFLSSWSGSFILWFNIGFEIPRPTLTSTLLQLVVTGTAWVVRSEVVLAVAHSTVLVLLSGIGAVPVLSREILLWRAAYLRAYFLLITADFGHNFHIIAERTRAQKVAERA